MNTKRRATTSLTAAFVKNASQPGKHHDGNGTGLYLRVEPNGSRFWVQRMMIRGKRRELGLGSPPTVTLAAAREAALDNKRTARAGGDPLAEKRKARAVLTFAEATLKAHVELSPTWKNPKDRASFLSSLETYAFPYFGTVPLPDVTSADVRQAVLAAREKAPGVAKKLVYRMSAVFKWGIAEGMCADNPSIAQRLALPRIEHAPKHRRALDYSEVAGCIEKIRASRAQTGTKLALEFLILNANRSGEVRLAHWEEFDFHGAGAATLATSATWEIPASRMKMKKAHKVPLSPRALEILREAEQLRDPSGLVFPSLRGKPLSDMTLSKLVKELGFDADVHGFRTSFRTWVQEKTDVPWEVAEAALAHNVGDAVERAYARSDLLDKRRAMMANWQAYLAQSEV